MNEYYTIKINQAEGVLEVSGEDKEWVITRVKELKELLVSSQPFNPTKVDSKKSQGDIEGNKTVKVTKRKSSGAKGRSQKNPELVSKLTKDVQQKFTDYVSERKEKFDSSLSAQAAIIATFLHDKVNWSGVDGDDIYTVYSVMGWEIPGNPQAQLNNALSRKHYFSGIEKGKYILSHNGENYGRSDAKSAK